MKKLLSLILALTMVFSFCCFFVSADEEEIIETAGEEFNGDVNGDGTVDSKDAIYLIRAILAPAAYPITFSGDVNGDCAATTADAIYLLRYTFFPEKYPIISKPLYPVGKNIAEGKSYDVEGYTVRADGYGDPDLVKLTDGVKDTTGAAAPAGFNGKDASIIINLAGTGYITGFVADLQGNAWGIPNPKGYTVNFAVSSDGETWTELGAGNQKAVLEQAEGWNVVDFYLTCETVEARYVKVNYVTPADYTGDHIWPSEIQVFGTFVPDYPEGKNIAEGKSYDVEGYTDRTDDYGDPEHVKLTDGVKDTTGGSAPAGFNGQNANIIIDLGSASKITGIITDLQGNAWGIPSPFGYTVNFAVSVDGETWTDLGAGYQKAVLEQETGWNIVDFYTVCDVEARYVKVNYVTPAGYTGSFIWPSEIQVIGESGEVEPEVLPIVITGDEGIAEVAADAIKKLYDGVFADGATAFGDDRLVGIEWQGFDYTEGAENGTKQVVLVYDLGELTDLTGVKLGAYKERNSFVDLPAVKVYLSNDGETYVRAADGKWTSEVEGLIESTERNGEAPKGAAVYFADWSTRASLKAQYIKLVLTYTDPWAFLSEVGYTTEIAAAKVDTALDANKGAPVDLVPLSGVDIAIADGTATILTAAAGEISLDSTAEGDYKLARAGVITVAKWDAEKGGYVVTFNEVNPWGPLNDGSGKSGNNRTGTLTIAEDEIGVFTISSGNIDNNGAAGKWVIWHIEVGDVLYVYDDVIAINHKIDGADSRCFVPEEEEPIQPEEKMALPEGAIAIDYAGYKHAAFVSIVAGSDEDVAALTLRGHGQAKDMNYACNILVGSDNKVIDVDFAVGTPCAFVCPEGGYIITYNANKAGYEAMKNIQVGATITLYNINLAPIYALEGSVELADAAFTYENPTITIDVDTTGWTYVDGVNNGKWQNDTVSVGTYYYNTAIEDGKYVIEVVFNGKLSGTAESNGNGKGTNLRFWFHTAKNAAETAQETYNAFMDIAYTPDGLIDTLKTNGSTNGNSGVLYEGEQIYTIESVIPTAKDGIYVKVVFDSIPNCLVNDDLDVIITVSNKPEDTNNALYSNNQLKPYAEPWNRRESVNFYPIPYTNVAANATMKVVGGAVEGDPIEAGDPAQNIYKTSLNDGVASTEQKYNNSWFAFYYNAKALDKCNAAPGTIGELEGNLGIVVADLGEATAWNQVKVNVWAALTSGIGGPIAIEAYSSDDGETWTDVGALKLGADKTVYMAVGNFADITSRYVKVEVLWTNGVYCFINEIEINNVGAAPEAEEGDEVAFDFNETAVDVKVNESVIGESVRIFKPGFLLSEGNLKWSINVVVTKAGENTYSVNSVAAGNGETPTIELADDQLIIAVHSDGVGQNVPGKNAALALKAGDILRITGLDPQGAEDQATVELLK